MPHRAGADRRLQEAAETAEEYGLHILDSFYFRETGKAVIRKEKTGQVW
jgi:hypothetical protein